MLRFVVGPEQNLVFDAAATLPGRGLWLSAKADVLESSIKRGVFARAAKQAVRVPPALSALVETSLRARVTDLIGLARRGGNAIAGFEKAREWLASGKVGLVVQASDGSADECRRFLGGRNVPVVTALNMAALGKIFGRDIAVHVVIAGGKLARMIEIDAARLAGVAGGGTSGQ
jgi:predicted RNA-binding protein YlxR (DUF448 family)